MPMERRGWVIVVERGPTGSNREEPDGSAEGGSLRAVTRAGWIDRVKSGSVRGPGVVNIAVDGGDGEHTPVAPVAQQAILGRDIAFDCQCVPRLGVAHIVDRDVIMLAPEERHGRELLSISEDVERRGLTLPLGDDPMFDASFCARVRIGPPRDIARRKDSRCAGLEVVINYDAAVECEARVLGESNTRAHADASNHDVGIERAAAA